MSASRPWRLAAVGLVACAALAPSPATGQGGQALLGKTAIPFDNDLLTAPAPNTGFGTGVFGRPGKSYRVDVSGTVARRVGARGGALEHYDGLYCFEGCGPAPVRTPWLYVGAGAPAGQDLGAGGGPAYNPSHRYSVPASVAAEGEILFSEALIRVKPVGDELASDIANGRIALDLFGEAPAVPRATARRFKATFKVSAGDDETEISGRGTIYFNRRTTGSGRSSNVSGTISMSNDDWRLTFAVGGGQTILRRTSSKRTLTLPATVVKRTDGVDSENPCLLGESGRIAIIDGKTDELVIDVCGSRTRLRDGADDVTATIK